MSINMNHLAVQNQLMFNEYFLQRKMVGMVIGVLMVFGTIAITSFLAVHDQNKRKAVVGTAGLVATAILYVSPLSVIVSFTLH